MAVTLTTSYQYIGRASAKTQNGSGTHYLLLYAKSSPNTTTGIHTVTVQTKLASNSGTFYGYSTTTSTGTINGTQAFSVSKMPNAAWSGKNAIASDMGGGTAFSQSFTLGSGSVDVDCTNGLAKDIAIQGYYYFNNDGATYTPPKGTKFTVNATVTLPAIPRAAEITAAPDFNDEENPTITIKNVMGTNATKLETCIAYQGSDGTWTSAAVPYREITDKTATSYTFNLTETERNALRALVPNSSTLAVSFYIKTTIGSNTFTKSVAKTMSIINANPTITWSSVEEQDTDVLKSEVKDLGVFLKGISDVKITTTPTMKKSATLKSIKYTHNGASLVTNPATFTNIATNSFSCTVTDSRGNTATSSHTVALLDYILPNASNLKIYRDTAVDPKKIKIDATINYFNSNFASGIANSISLVLSNSAGTKQTITNYSVSGNTIIINGLETDFTLAETASDTYTLTITDKVTSVPVSKKVSLLVPTLEMGQYDVQVNGSLYIADTSRGNIKTVGKYVANEIYPVGAIYMSTTSTSPASLFGGTWERIQGQFLLAGNDAYDQYKPGASGGATNVTLTTANLPAHTHGSKSLSGWFRLRKSTGDANEITAVGGIVTSAAYTTTNTTITNSSTKYNQQTITINATHEHDSVGSGTSFGIMPPFLAVYVWKRTA